MKKISLRNILFFVIMIAINYLGAKGFINGNSQKDISDMYKTLVTPAGYAFSIWGAIYITLAISFLILLFKYRDRHIQDIIYRISKLFWISAILNMLWIISYSFNMIIISMILIILLTLNIIYINIVLLDLEFNTYEYIIPLSFGLYAGWLSIATIANLFNLLSRFNLINTYNKELTATVIALILGSFIISLIGLKLKNIMYYLASAWGIVAIYNNMNSPSANLEISHFFIGLTLFLGILKAFEAGWSFLRNDKGIIPKKD